MSSVRDRTTLQPSTGNPLRAAGPHSSPRWMKSATVGSLIISALTTVVTGADLRIPLRPYLVLVALCVVPGVAAWARQRSSIALVAVVMSSAKPQMLRR